MSMTKMAKVDTLHVFMTKMAETPYPLVAHTYILHITEYHSPGEQAPP